MSFDPDDDVIELVLQLVAKLREERLAHAIQLDRMEEKLDALAASKPFYTVREVAALIRKRPSEVEKLLSDGVLWTLDGLESTKRIIPAAALNELQKRPAASRT